MRAIFTAVFRHAFYRRISSPEVSVALNCVAAEAAAGPDDDAAAAAAAADADDDDDYV